MPKRVLAAGMAVILAAVAPGAAVAESTWARIFSHWGYTARFGRATATADGGCVVVGYTAAFGGYYYDGWVGKLDAEGKWQWQKTLGGLGRDGFTEVIQTRDGGYLLVGYRSWESYYGGESWCVRMDSDGRKLWERTFAKVDLERVQESEDGGFLLAGPDWDNEGCKLLKLDSVGGISLNRTYSPRLLIDVNTLGITPDGGAVIQASYNAILKLDRSGDPQWLKTYTLPAMRYGGLGSVTVMNDGGYLVVGGYSEGGCAVLKLDSNGDPAWSERIDLESYYLVSGYEDRDGTIVIATAGQGAALARLDSSGQVLWAKRYRVSGEKGNLTVSPSADGSIILAASRSAYDFHLLLYSKGFAFRTSWDGTIDACEGLVKPLDPTVEPLDVKIKVLSSTASEPEVVMSSPVSRVLPASVGAYDICAHLEEGGER
ncbi:MAG: hypothetical protein AB1714_03180 [Acidobacteriota bacterium]